MTGSAQEYRYEFSFMWNARIHFVILWDKDDLSACQRVLAQPIQNDIIKLDTTTGNGFIRDTTYGINYVFKKSISEPSYVVPDCKPHPSELTSAKQPKSDILSQHGF